MTVSSESEEVRDASVEDESSETPLVSVLIDKMLAEVEVEETDESEESDDELSPVADLESLFDDLFFALD